MLELFVLVNQVQSISTFLTTNGDEFSARTEETFDKYLGKIRIDYVETTIFWAENWTKYITFVKKFLNSKISDYDSFNRIVMHR